MEYFEKYEVAKLKHEVVKIHRENIKPFSREETRKLGRTSIIISALTLLFIYKFISFAEISTEGFKINFGEENNSIFRYVLLFVNIYFFVIYSIEILSDWESRVRTYEKIEEISKIEEGLKSKFSKIQPELDTVWDLLKQKKYEELENQKDILDEIKPILDEYVIVINELNRNLKKGKILEKIRVISEVFIPIIFNLLAILICGSQIIEKLIAELFKLK